MVVPIRGSVQSLGTYTGGRLCPLNTHTSCMIFSQSACCTTNIFFCNALYTVLSCDKNGFEIKIGLAIGFEEILTQLHLQLKNIDIRHKT